MSAAAEMSGEGRYDTFFARGDVTEKNNGDLIRAVGRVARQRRRCVA